MSTALQAVGTNYKRAVPPFKEMHLLSASQFHYYWPQIQTALKTIPRFFEYYTDEWVLDQALRGHLQGWAIGEAEIDLIILTQIIEFPACRVLRFLGVVGKSFDEYVEFIAPRFQRIAQMQGCQKMEAYGRKGWERRLAKFGVEQTACFYTRNVDPAEDE